MPDASQSPRRSFWPSGLPRGAALLWLALVLLILLSVPLFGLLAGLRTEVAQLRLAALTAQISGAVAPAGRPLAAAEVAAGQLAAAQATVEAAVGNPIPWRAILERAMPEPGVAVGLTSLQQDGATLAIAGVAADDSAFADYLARLQGTALFDVATLEASTSSTSGGQVAFTIAVRLRGAAP